MNIVIVGFSTTGKSSILKEVTGLSENVLLLDSDSEISKDYNSHIYNLFITNHNEYDPITRSAIMNKIESKEIDFIEFLKQQTQPYIAALGPILHGRPNWNSYYLSSKPFVVFLKADTSCVYEGLKRREDEMPEGVKQSTAFGNWNLDVIRGYNPNINRYFRLERDIAMANINQMVIRSEHYFSQIANVTFEATNLFPWHSNFNQTKKDELISLLKI
jgi:shikimate kinase